MGYSDGTNPLANTGTAIKNIENLVERFERNIDPMLGLHESLALAKTDHYKTLLQRQITATDKQIDKLVYELYGLSDEEIGIVEGAE